MQDHKFVLILNDVHVGHALAPFPRNELSSTGANVGLNRVQAYLNACWYDHFLSLLPQKIDLLFLNGEMAEGQNLSDQARELVEVDPVFQARAALKLLEPIIDRVLVVGGQRQIYALRGSGYHTGKGGWLDEHVGAMTGAIKHWSSRSTYCWKQHYLTNKVLFDVAHKQSTGKRSRASGLEAEVGYFWERIAREGKVRPEHVVVVRSHTHVGYKCYEEAGVTAVSTPAWKCQDDYGSSLVNPNRIKPENLGAVGFRVYDTPVDGSLVHKVLFLYKHPDLEMW